MHKAIVLFSGGLDSTTCLALALRDLDPCNVYTMSFSYGQRHEAAELEQANKILDHYHIPVKNRTLQQLSFTYADQSCTLLGGTLSDGDLARSTSEPAPSYVPGRNLLFIAYANSLAEAIGANKIFVGVNQVDFSGYPDCRAEFISAMQGALNALGMNIHLETPLIDLSKADIASLGYELGAPLHLTHSCYRGTRPACGTCDSCLLRLRGFREAGLEDPIEYQLEP